MIECSQIVNANNTSIKEVILKYINAETRNIYEIIEKKMSHDFRTKQEDVKDLIKYSGILMKIQVHLD